MPPTITQTNDGDQPKAAIPSLPPRQPKEKPLEWKNNKENSMSIAIFFRTWWRGRLIGEDSQGNKYYEDKKKMRYGKPRRWVMYKGRAEASKVPANWHGWLHFMTSEPPQLHQHYPWEKEHLPNLTGTSYAHQPKGLKGIVPPKDYEAWTPEGLTKK